MEARPIDFLDIGYGQNGGVCVQINVQKVFGNMKDYFFTSLLKSSLICLNALCLTE